MRLLPLVSLLMVAAAVPSKVEAQRKFGSYVRRAFDYRAVEIGVVGGPNRSTVTGAGAVDPEIRGMLGGFVSVRLGEGFRLRPEMLVSGKQVSVTTEIFTPCLPPGPCPAIHETETTSLTWIEAPILLEYRFDRIVGSHLAPKLFAGPFLAIRVGCSLSTPVSNPDPTTGDRLVRECGSATTQPNTFNNGDAGFVVGGALGTGSVAVGLRWTRSLVEMAPFQAASFNRLTGGKQSTLAVTLELATRLW